MIAENNDIDKQVDNDIFNCLNPEIPQSFFLFAGAGSGKTKTLVNVLSMFKENYGIGFKLYNKKIAIITYTNAATEEINHRLSYDSIFVVSTIHSFCWELIQNFTSDIKSWIEKDSKESIAELEDKLSRARDQNNKTALSNRKKIESKRKRLENLESISKFEYSPVGDNSSKASLNHQEVISITCSFLTTKNLFRQIVINKYPIILIDESQDTKEKLIDSLFQLQSDNKDRFCLGFFGDSMQRIYADGKEGLEKHIPEDWCKPRKQMNHRSKARIIELNNKIRANIDGQKQLARIENSGGHVMFFIASRTSNKIMVESQIKNEMALCSSDKNWIAEGLVKTLTLEHHMASIRMGFSSFFIPLYQVDRLKQGLLEGTLSYVNFFIKVVLPIYSAHKKNNKFEISNIVKRHSILFDKKNIEEAPDKSMILQQAKEAVDSLLCLWDNDKNPTLLEILLKIDETKLFNIPSELKLSIERTKSTGEEENLQDDDEVLRALDQALRSSFSEIIKYNEYISDNSAFGTHQGVKGLEFDRVMVIIDDEESKGFMFSYDKLFEVKSLSDSDTKNIKEGKETGIERTSRLFYVACSRAKKSLAIVAYTDEPEKLKSNVLRFGWFSEQEIKIL